MDDSSRGNRKEGWYFFRTPSRICIYGDFAFRLHHQFAQKDLHRDWFPRSSSSLCVKKIYGKRALRFLSSLSSILHFCQQLPPSQDSHWLRALRCAGTWRSTRTFSLLLQCSVAFRKPAHAL